MKRCTIELIIEERKIETIMGHHHISLGKALVKIRKRRANDCWQRCWATQLLLTVSWNVNRAAAVEYDTAVP